ncbi:MAG: glycoside hydrolase family 13 protein, partial [Clostridia bacterium]
VLYQIFPDRFARSTHAAPPPEGLRFHQDWHELPDYTPATDSQDNQAADFFGGNLDGIREKLPYLQSLGVTALYLNPIFQAHTNHRYDTCDYRQIDPLLGDTPAFTALCQAASKHGIRVLLDGVFSHTGRDSRYFQDACHNPTSAYARWYTFTHWPDAYDCWWGIPTLPNVRELDPSYLDFQLRAPDATVRTWLQAGASGWRLDVADELPVPFLQTLRTAVKQTAPDAAIIGEVWEDASNKITYGKSRSYCLGDTLDSVMNYPLRSALIAFLTRTSDAPHVKRQLDALYDRYPRPFSYALMNLLSSHDQPRILNTLAGFDGASLSRTEQRHLTLSAAQRAVGLVRLRVMLRIICALPGMPCLYYGDEAGMTGGPDPYCRQTFPWDTPDHALQDEVSMLFHLRRHCLPLTSGTLLLLSPDAHTLVLVRRIRNGLDALGESAPNGCAICVARSTAEETPVCIDAALTGVSTLYDERNQPHVAQDGLFSLPIPPSGCLYRSTLHKKQAANHS